MGAGPPRHPGRAWKVATLALSLVWLAASFAQQRGLGRVDLARAQSRPRSTQVSPKAVAVSVSRVPSSELRALLFLCHRGPTGSTNFDLGGGETVFGPVAEKALSPSDRVLFDQQWATATAAARWLMTPDQATAAGYVQAAPFNSGVGTHWIKWSLVGRPFDPAHPSMLLFDGLPGHAVQLVGFAYWVQSARQPAGFSGSNDHWHRHAGLCFTKDGWLDRQGVKSKNGCNGYWLNGRDLWMLHAWVVPTFPNRWGRLAPTNPALCPPPTKDVLACQ